MFCLTCMHMMGLLAFTHLLELYSVKMWCTFVLSYLYLRIGDSTFFTMCYLFSHILVTGPFPKQIWTLNVRFCYQKCSICSSITNKIIFFSKLGCCGPCLSSPRFPSKQQKGIPLFKKKLLFLFIFV